VSGSSLTVEEAVGELVTANRVLANEGFLDALGHLSRRHPGRPERYLLSCSRSPALVSADDIMALDLDNNPLDPRGRPMYAEGSVHGSVYAARPEVNSVWHSHAQPLIAKETLRRVVQTAINLVANAALLAQAPNGPRP
jgi:ribulose-5-phosphate 4-epimerase/fuculose-1-phosphate aldolase